MNLLTLEKHELIQKINTLEKKNEELELLNKNNKTWIALLAHDFRGVFANLIWVLNLYRNKTVPFEVLVDDLIPELEQSAHKNIKALDDTFLSLKIQLEAALLDKETINLKDKHTAIQQALADELTKKELTFDFVGDEELFISSNKLIVISILRKIVDNAIKFSFRGGEIRFKVEKTNDDRTQITIQDFGTGIDEYTLNKLFSLDAVPLRGTEEEKGAGLGLVLVKEALGLINGTIDLSSTKDKGTQVQIIL